MSLPKKKSRKSRKTPERIQKKIAKKRGKSERLTGAAARGEREVEARRSRRPEIPFGQPITSPRDAASRRRMWKSDEVTFRKMDEAKGYRRRAESAEKRAKMIESDPTFAARRIKELESEQRRIERSIAKVDSRDYEDVGFNAEYGKSLKAGLIENTKDLEAWREHLKSLGGAKYSRDTMKVGDEINYIGWRKVLKLNPKSVTVEWKVGGFVTTKTVPYSQIKEVRKAKGDTE